MTKLYNMALSPLQGGRGEGAGGGGLEELYNTALSPLQKAFFFF